MANFKTHIWWGGIIGVGILVAGLLTSIISGAETMVWIFLAVLVGSFLPDLDIDEGVPFQILFGLLAAGLAGMVFFNFYQDGTRDLKILILLPVLTFVIVRFVIGRVFERFTHHRGMFHSIPSAALAGVLACWALNFFDINQKLCVLAGFAVGIGYLGHLILDEIYSTINFHGLKFSPKKSLGSAMKFWSSSRLATIFVYLALLVSLIVFNS
ncbi:MAG: metal-dependent hydrolase [Patescibacteria group bacterium]|nr:metal-dependent hydrolase [Patescibacteria group bacterium]